MYIRSPIVTYWLLIPLILLILSTNLANSLSTELFKTLLQQSEGNGSGSEEIPSGYKLHILEFNNIKYKTHINIRQSIGYNPVIQISKWPSTTSDLILEGTKNSNNYNLIFLIVNGTRNNILRGLKYLMSDYGYYVRHPRTIVFLTIYPKSSDDKSFKHIYQIILNSGHFQSSNPKMVVIVTPNWESNSTWMPICYLCDINLHPSPTTGPILNVTELYKTLTVLNSKGYGKPAHTPNNLTNSTQDYQLIAKSRKAKRSMPTTNILMGILTSELNFTFSSTPIFSPRLYVCSPCRIDLGNRLLSGEQFLKYRHHVNTLHMNVESFFYCQADEEHADFYIATIFFKPFETKLWICIFLMTALIIGFVYRKNPWEGYTNILWSLIALPIKRRKRITESKKNRLFVPSYIILFGIFVSLQFPYMAYFTSDVIAPLPPIRIPTNNELFKTNGFRIIGYLIEINNGRLQGDPGKYTKELNTDQFFRNLTTNEWEHIWRQSYEEFSHDWANKGTYLLEPKFTELQAAKIETQYQNLHCDTVAEEWDSYWFAIYSNSHLSKEFSKKLWQIQSAGLNVHAENLFMDGTRAQVANEKKKSFYVKEKHKYLWFVSLMKVCAILLSLSALVLFCEILYANRRNKSAVRPAGEKKVMLRIYRG